MKIIKSSGENPIEATCPECNTLFSFVLPEVDIITAEEESEIANYRSTGFLKGEYFVSVYKTKKAIVACPYCENTLPVKGYMEKALKTEKIGERVLTRQELKHRPIW